MATDKEYNREYYLKNKEQKQTRNRENYLKNRDSLLKYAKNKRDSRTVDDINKDKQRQREYYLANKERIKQKRKEVAELKKAEIDKMKEELNRLKTQA
jgi:hypothetical protein